MPLSVCRAVAPACSTRMQRPALSSVHYPYSRVFRAVSVGQRASSILGRIGCHVKRPFLSPFWSNVSNSSTGGALRKAGIVWFRNDLRLHDHEALSKAQSECTSILPVFCFDPREYGCVKKTKYNKTGPYRATFVIDAVRDLRDRLRERGSDLMVAIGKPEDVIPAVARKIGATALYCHTEVTYEESRVENAVKHAFLEESKGVGTFNSFWTNTLHHVEDLPSGGLERLPQSFDEFKSNMEGIQPRRSIEEQTSGLKGLPMGGVSMGDVPTLKDLGIAPLETAGCEEDRGERAGVRSSSEGTRNASGKSNSSHPSYRGGETEALRQLRKFVSSLAVEKNVAMTSFSGNIAPWLASGCLSPRKMLESVMEHARGEVADASLKWVQFELLWRDFFRLLSRRFVSVQTKQLRAQHAASVV